MTSIQNFSVPDTFDLTNTLSRINKHKPNTKSATIREALTHYATHCQTEAQSSMDTYCVSQTNIKYPRGLDGLLSGDIDRNELSKVFKDIKRADPKLLERIFQNVHNVKYALTMANSESTLG